MLCSIIIPVYNAEKYLSKSIESILQQTHQDFELIIINDGSTDNSEEVIKSYLYDSRIKYFSQTNKGEAAARNRGIAESKGEYIAFLDADDLYSPTKLTEQITYFQENHEFDIVYSDIEVINEKGLYIGELKSEQIIKEPNDFLANILYRQIIPGPAAIMLRRKCIESGIRYPENYVNAEDYLFTIQLAQHFKIGYLPKKLYLYRRHENNLTNNHLKQIENEKKIVQSLGVENIIKIIRDSTYIIEEQNLLMAKVLLKIDELSSALNFLEDSSDNWEYFFVKGIILYKLKDYKKAKEIFELAWLKEEKAEILNNLGCIYWHFGDIKKAELHFKNALQLREEYGDPRYNLDCITQNNNPKLTEKKLRVKLTKYN